MPFDGSGNFTRSMNWAADAAANIKILASRHDTEDNNFAAGLSLVLCRDGQGGPTADINWNGKKITNLAAPVNGTDAANKTYVDGIRNFSTPIVITGSHPNAQLKYTGSTGPWGESFVTADMASGVRGTTWVWNDKADFSGKDVMTLVEAGTLSLTSPASSAVINLNKASGAAGLYNIIYGKAGATTPLTRWGLFLGDGTAEVAVTNTSVGSDFAIWRYDDTGAAIAQGLGINRASGLVTAIGGLQAGPTAKQSNAVLSAVGNGNGFEWGHANTAGYRCTLGSDFTGGTPWQAFSGEAGTTANTFRTRGKAASIIKSDLAGGFQWGNAPLVNADDQAFVSRMYLTVAGVLSLSGGVASTTPTTGTMVITGGVGVSGDINAGGNVSAATNAFMGSANAVILGTAPGGTGQVLYLRPVAWNSSAGQVTLNAAGLLDAINIHSDSLAQGVYSQTGASAGCNLSNVCYISTASTSTVALQRYCNPNGIVGYVQTSGAGTSFGTTSDETLKEFNAEYDPAEAIAIIRADPVLGFTWKATGEEAVGWFAQKSYAVDENLAMPPPYSPDELAEMAEGREAAKPGEEGYVPWGIDYGRRTPYLWAALTSVLDRLEAIEAKLGGEPPKPSMKRKAA
jgi:hypothetical protein